MERNRGVNCIKAADGLSWSTYEQGFVSRGEIPYGILRKKEMNNKRKEDKSEKTLTKKDEQLKKL